MAKQKNNNNSSDNGQTRPSVGSIAIIETKTGKLRVHLDFAPQPTTDSQMLERIKYAVAGLAYLYEQNGDIVETTGRAYLEGIEEGIRQLEAHNRQTDKKSKGYKGHNIGFKADV